MSNLELLLFKNWDLFGIAWSCLEGELVILIAKEAESPLVNLLYTLKCATGKNF
jgi:hypothetical protein